MSQAPMQGKVFSQASEKNKGCMWLGDEGGVEDESGTDPAFVLSGF